MEVDDDGDRRVLVRISQRRGEDARPEAAGRVDGDVGGAHPGDVRARAGARLEVAEGDDEAPDAAVRAVHERERGQLHAHRPRQWRRPAPGAVIVRAAGHFTCSPGSKRFARR